MKEYHGDLHTDNIIIQRYGLGFDLKLLDFYHWGAARPENIHDDVVDLIRILYDAVGGHRHYKHQPQVIKYIVLWSEALINPQKISHRRPVAGAPGKTDRGNNAN